MSAGSPRPAVLLVERFGALGGVSGIRAESFAQAVSETGADVLVLRARPDPPPATTQPAPRGRRDRLRRTAEQVLPGLVPRWTPDVAMARWAAAAPQVGDALRECPGAVVFSTSPPQSVHVAAADLPRSGPWVADFRDPFSTDPALGRRRRIPVLAGRLDRVEQRICHGADVVLVVTPHHQRVLQERYPQADVRLVENGFPNAMLPLSAPSSLPTAPVRVAVVGAVGLDRAVRLRHVVESLQDHFDGAEVHYFGPEVARVREVFGGARVRVQASPSVPQEELVEALRSMTVVVSAKAPGAAASISSKLYEYAALGVPILALGPQELDVEWLAHVPNSVVDDLTSGAEAVATTLADVVRAYQPELARAWLSEHAVGLSRRSRWAPVVAELFGPPAGSSGEIRVRTLRSG
jgi:glycosyltransferase involved in cell wall biosynthesis